MVGSMSHPGVIALIKMRRVKGARQGELPLVEHRWDGPRAGAGRKANKQRREPAHRARPEHKARHPVHVVLRTRREVGRLRRRAVFQAVRRAMSRMVTAAGTFRVVHASIQHNHLHLLVEAKDKRALSRGMQTLAINVAKAVNRSLGRSGKVFEFRYHGTAITTPRQARNALAYVLNNWRRHREDVANLKAADAHLDPYSTAIAFNGWKGFGRFIVPPGYGPLPSADPATWLLRVGWRKHGELDVREIPGPRP